MHLLFLVAFALAKPDKLLDDYVATGSPEVLRQVRVAFDTEPEGYRRRLLGARLLFVSGDSKRALVQAEACNREMPDDLAAYELITDIALSQREYVKAEHAAGWMLRLRAEDPRSLRAAAAVREALGDFSGAGDMLRSALARLARTDVSIRADLGVKLARCEAKLGRIDDAIVLLRQVERLTGTYKPATDLLRDLEGQSK